MYVKVSIPKFLFKSFTYSIPSELLDTTLYIGQSINVPFRKNNQNGFIISIFNKPDFQGKILDINSINKNAFHINKELQKTLFWISKYYCCPIGKVLNIALPFQHQMKFSTPKEHYIKISKKGISDLNQNKIKYHNQLYILKFLSKKNNDFINVNIFKDKIKSLSQTCKRLEDKEYILSKKAEKIKGLLNQSQKTISKILKLTKEQKFISSQIQAHYKKNMHQPAVLSGVPGSGKTMIYIDLIKKMISNNKSVIVLVPEISLISPTYDAINSYFSKSVGIWHSKMNQSEKNLVLKNLRNSSFNIIVGTRSCLFLPINNLGFITVDEEHESAYKQEANAPLYHARDVAIIRSKFNKSPILLVSSTPSIETYFNLNEKKYTGFHLEKKYSNSLLPSIKLINMSAKENYVKNSGILSKMLIDKIQETVKNNKQVLLLQNRRGFSYIIKCSSCDYIKKCINCSTPLKFHQTSNILQCHHCTYKTKNYNSCEKCSSDLIELSGTGTQKIESILHTIFPNYKVLRYDRDSIKNKDNYFTLLNKFESGKANILIGTQMIAKGIDFKNVALVGILNSDIGLYATDYRAGERIFQLIYQLIGRAGRHLNKSTAVIQSFNTSDIHVKYACQLNIEKMYNHILSERKQLFYPPYSRLIRILVSGENKESVKKRIDLLHKKLQTNKNLTVLGPSLAPIEKINKKWRYHILIKSDKKYWQELYNWMNKYLMNNIYHSTEIIKFDVDPISLL